ncbi:MAG: class I SAM-dependent methyltransferase, partial [Gemmatimonadaceae bacterium]|nr:class I SAM-dependent methyltransferase [Gemmatimonadaceae bacterium]
SRILDVGCGQGLLLQRLVDAGFDGAIGIDPFIAADARYAGRILVKRGTLDEMDGTFDLVMFHHSLEHIGSQRDTLARAAELLRDGGHCLVRIPVADSWAWEEYRDRWVQLDAPRHLFLHSVNSLRQLAESVGLQLDRVVHDSTAFAMEGSELYRRDRPLTGLPSAGFSPEQRRAFGRQARELNASGRGDQAAFYLRKA